VRVSAASSHDDSITAADKDNENRNEYSAFVRTRRARGRRSIAVTGKRGHRVYASRDRRRGEVEDVPVSCRGGRCTVGYCQPVHRARGWSCVCAERGVSISRSHAHPGIVLVIVSSLGTWEGRDALKSGKSERRRSRRMQFAGGSLRLSRKGDKSHHPRNARFIWPERCCVGISSE